MTEVPQYSVFPCVPIVITNSFDIRIKMSIFQNEELITQTKYYIDLFNLSRENSQI